MRVRFILNKIAERSKSGEELSREYSEIPHSYKRHGLLDLVVRLQILEHRLREYDASVFRSGPEDISETVARILTGRGKSRIAVPLGVSTSVLPPSFEFIVAEDLLPRELDCGDGLLSGCTVAIAATGTLVLQNAPAQGARELSFVLDSATRLVAGRRPPWPA